MKYFLKNQKKIPSIKVQYTEGEAKIIDFMDQPNLEVNLIKNCLQTKWPTIEVKWLNCEKAPSMN